MARRAGRGGRFFWNNVRESRDGGQIVSFKGGHEEASGLSVHPALPSPAQAMFDLGRRASSGMPFTELAEFAVAQIAQQFVVPCVALMEIKDGTLVPVATF